MLPPPNWSPTGNSGTWHWSDGCWKWHDDVHGVEWKKGLHGTMKGRKAGLLEQRKKGWFEKLKDIF